MFEGLQKRVHRYVSFRRVAGLYRRRLSRRVFEQLQGTIAHGPFAGMKWLDHPGWGRSDQGVVVLGLYEQEVATHLVSAPEQYRTFVDVGAADGYYAVGLLFAKRVERSIAFEMLPAARAAIQQLAERNHVADRITILGAAEADFVATLHTQNLRSAETMFLFDIEGAEFRLLTEDFFQQFAQSVVVVELHPNIYPDPQAEVDGLLERASRTHAARMWTSGGRNPWEIEELNDGYSELDRWILCSEGRQELQKWIRFDPLRSSH